jgi:taurine dioxygenase
MVAFEKLSQHTGAEIRGIDLRQPLDRDVAKQIYDIFVEHCVILFRDQDLSQDELVRASANFGTLAAPGRPAEFRPSGMAEMNPQVMLITNIREDGKAIGALPDGEMWFHHDTIHRELPTKATMLYSVQVPTYGGETVFSNLFAAYEALPLELKQALEGRQALNAYSFNSTYKDDANAVAARNHAIHPAIRTHEDSKRKAIYVNRLMTQQLVGLPEDESRDILERVFDHIEQPEFLYEHAWRKGDALMWDNRSSIHARKDFPADQIRLMWRTVIAGETRPF